MLCSKLHCQKGLKLKPFFYKFPSSASLELTVTLFSQVDKLGLRDKYVNFCVSEAHRLLYYAA